MLTFEIDAYLVLQQLWAYSQGWAFHHAPSCTCQIYSTLCWIREVLGYPAKLNALRSGCSCCLWRCKLIFSPLNHLSIFSLCSTHHYVTESLKVWNLISLLIGWESITAPQFIGWMPLAKLLIFLITFCCWVREPCEKRFMRLKMSLEQSEQQFSWQTVAYCFC